MPTQPLAERNKLSSLMVTYCVPLLSKMGHPEVQAASLNEQLGLWVSRLGPLALPSPPIPDPLPYWRTMTAHLPLLGMMVMVRMNLTNVCDLPQMPQNKKPRAV